VVFGDVFSDVGDFEEDWVIGGCWRWGTAVIVVVGCWTGGLGELSEEVLEFV
jgi:hypothetical protein